MDGMEMGSCHKWGMPKGEDGLANRILKLCLPCRVLGGGKGIVSTGGVGLRGKGAGLRGEALASWSLLGRWH